MNERIRELAEQAGFTANDEQKVFLKVYEQELGKFAELIVQECCDVLYDNELGGYRVNYVLKEHFGVEE
jgi:hypothetical protein